jgi:DNA-binding response OmpR family regulator
MDERLKILLIDDDELLISDAQRLGHPDIEFSSLTRARAAASKKPLSKFDIVVVAVDAPGALDLIGELCLREGTPPVIALGGRGTLGRSLEQILILAEMRGAALALPKPIDPIELALAALELIGRRSPEKTQVSMLVKDLERRLAY